MDDAQIAIPSTFTENIFHKLNSLDQHLYFRWDLTSDTVTLQLPVPRKFRDLPQEVHQASTMLWTQELLHPEHLFACCVLHPLMRTSLICLGVLIMHWPTLFGLFYFFMDGNMHKDARFAAVCKSPITCRRCWANASTWHSLHLSSTTGIVMVLNETKPFCIDTNTYNTNRVDSILCMGEITLDAFFTAVCI